MKTATFLFLVASLFVVALAHENSTEVKCEVDKPRMVDYCRNLIGLGVIDESVRSKLWSMDMDELFDLLFEGLRNFIELYPEMKEKGLKAIEYFEIQKEICGF